MPIRSSHDSRGVVLAVICFFLLPKMMNAAVTLPLNGYCKPGRFFPVKVDGDDAAHSITFSANGCVPTLLNASQHGPMIIPMLVMGAPKQLEWPGGSAVLLTPRDDERLIAATSDQVSEALPIFPGNRLIPVKLDAADLLSGPPAAWESLDAILLNTELFARVSNEQRSTLLAAGVTLAAIGEKMPDTRWPWHREGSLWILRCPIAGPMQIVDENAYLPTFTWQPGWSAAVRWQVMGAATLLMLIIIALLIQQTRFTRWSAIALPLIVSAGVVGWRRTIDNIDARAAM